MIQVAIVLARFKSYVLQVDSIDTTWKKRLEEYFLTECAVINSKFICCCNLCSSFVTEILTLWKLKKTVEEEKEYKFRHRHSLNFCITHIYIYVQVLLLVRCYIVIAGVGDDDDDDGNSDGISLSSILEWLSSLSSLYFTRFLCFLLPLLFNFFWKR